MAGIVFIKTKDLATITSFYIDVIGMKRWLSQPKIEILQHQNLLLGFHEQDDITEDCLITFYYETKQEVDEMYRKLSPSASDPKDNQQYRIYHFFAKDPEGRSIEFQKFLDTVPSISINSV